MKTLLIALFGLGLLSCAKSRSGSESFPDYQTAGEDWITFEGVLPSKNGPEVLVTLQLMPGPPRMDGYFKLTQTLGNPDRRKIPMGIVNSNGRYSVLLASQGEHVIHIARHRLSGSLMIGKDFRSSDQIAEDLVFKGNNDQLVLVDGRVEAVNPGYTLFRRSDLFTVEGYVTVYSDTSAEFYERNTQKNWPVAQLACYDEAVTKYHLQAKEKYEGIYLKALSYTVRQLDAEGEEVDALVFKRILVMDSPGTRHE